jgi:hypothetical protein
MVEHPSMFPTPTPTLRQSTDELTGSRRDLSLIRPPSSKIRRRMITSTSIDQETDRVNQEQWFPSVSRLACIVKRPYFRSRFDMPIRTVRVCKSIDGSDSLHVGRNTTCRHVHATYTRALDHAHVRANKGRGRLHRRHHVRTTHIRSQAKHAIRSTYFMMRFRTITQSQNRDPSNSNK